MNPIQRLTRISRRASLGFAALSLALFACGLPTLAAAKPKVLIATSMGDITVELNSEKAPNTVKNFLEYVKAGHYSGTIFHRVIDGFMIQGGGMDATMNEKTVRAPIKIESSNGLKNTRGTIAMARTQDPNSATAQFFINVVDNEFLNYKKYEEDTTITTPRGTRVFPKGHVNDGYTVFGEVTSGMDVVDKIKTVAVTTKPPHANVPVEAVTIKSVKVIDAK